VGNKIMVFFFLPRFMYSEYYLVVVLKQCCIIEAAAQY